LHQYPVTLTGHSDRIHRKLLCARPTLGGVTFLGDVPGLDRWSSSWLRWLRQAGTVMFLFVVPIGFISSNGRALAYITFTKYDSVGEPRAAVPSEDIAIINAPVNKYEDGGIRRQQRVNYEARDDNRNICFTDGEMFRGNKDNFWIFSLIKIPRFRQDITGKHSYRFVMNPTRATSKVSNNITKFQGSGGSSYAVDSHFIHPQLGTFRIHEGVGIRYCGSPQRQREQRDKYGRDSGYCISAVIQENESTISFDSRTLDQRAQDFGRVFFGGLFGLFILLIGHAYLK
jgi:hypothetical protein